ncbi:serine/threonine protein phosphatase 2A 57 kDa regulatory subunit B' kappa isoform-like [Curcuma longa]|uniref:serine/threonine protein phosphatase 2A 57 kDa regulatory subunit B' kappa isoform-like n=1 Tax=Curcuma longa TaxID=136217 RepID=UPI003D9E8C6B
MMWKQLLSKIPRKSSKSDTSSGSLRGHGGNDGAPSGDGNQIQRTSSGNVLPSRATTTKRTASAIFPSSVVTSIEPLLTFRDVPAAEKQNLFLSKLSLCNVIFDFSDPNKNSSEKEMKRQALLDLIDYVDAGTSKFVEPVISASCQMFATNLFRAFPPNSRSSTSGGETEEEEPMFDPAWPHLQLIYDLLLKFIESSSFDAKIGKKYVDHFFIVKLLDLFDSEDPRERDCLKTILHRIYGKFMVHRPFIRKAVSNIFYRFVFETEKHNGIAELLEVFGSVISGFALPLKEEHKIFLVKALLPLHKPKTLGVYLQQLTCCVAQFVEKEPKLINLVIKGLLKYWPITSSQKEVMFLSELEEVLEATNIVEFQDCVVPLFQRIALCVTNSHFQVAERALFLWNNDHVINLVSQNRQAIMPLIFPALERNIQCHWNQSVLNLTQNVKKMLPEMDPELFVACERQHHEDEEKRKVTEETRRMIWERLETIASFQSVTGNTPVLVRPTITPSITAVLS